MNIIKRQSLFVFSLIGIVVVSISLMTTYAYQSTKIDYNKDSNKGISVNSGVLDVNFASVNYIDIDNMPLLNDYLTADYVEFNIDNTKSDADVTYYIELTELDFKESLKSKDFKYTLTEVITENKEKNIGEGNFFDLTKEDYKLKFNNSYYLDIEKGLNKTFRLYIWLKETESNQNYLENSNFKAKIKITSQFKSSLYENSLAYDIKTKNEIKENIDVFDSDTNGLIKINDAYYFRGNINNNYVNYGNMCFRIVNINSDESIKLILEDKDNLCENSIGNYEIGNGQNMTQDEIDTNLLKSLNEFQNNYLKDYLEYLKTDNLCLENDKFTLDNNKLTDINVNEYNYLPKRRLIGKMVYDNNCVGKLINKFDNNEDIYVSELSVDDLTYIGYNTNLEYISYLNNDYFVNKNKDFWLLSLSSYKDGIVYEYKLSNNILTENNINESANYRPVITLIKNVSHIKGDGTKTNPYYIK